MKKELKSGILSADKSADGRPTVFLANVIAVLLLRLLLIALFLHDKLLPEPHLGNLAVSTGFGLMGTQH